jgi:hypothetical protein
MAIGGFCEKVIKINYRENGRSVTVRTDRTRSSGGNPRVESQKEGRKKQRSKSERAKLVKDGSGTKRENIRPYGSRIRTKKRTEQTCCKTIQKIYVKGSRRRPGQETCAPWREETGGFRPPQQESCE